MDDLSEVSFCIKRLPADYDYLAPDGSEIHQLLEVKSGSLAHCTLPPHGVSLTVTHQTVDEIWYFLFGQGLVWRKWGTAEEVVEVSTGVCLMISQGMHFQFRNTGQEPLCFIIATMPPWPSEQEAIYVEGHWVVE